MSEVSNVTLQPMASTSRARLAWIDHLRTLVIALVVNLHACVTYSHVGDWYWMSEPEPTLAQKVPFIVWEAHLQSFFMGLLFFISGYFAHRSLARRGTARFVRERVLRLAAPTLLYMLVIHPFILLGLNPWNARFGPPFDFYMSYVRSGRFLRSSGPLWFAFALLIFCLVLAAWRSVLRRGARARIEAAESEMTQPPAAAAPSAGLLWLFALALGLGTFAVRLVQPIGTSVLNMQLCFFVQYVAFFIAGLHAARHGWLLPMAASRRARLAGWLALVGGPLLLLAIIVTGAKGEAINVFLGGWHWQAMAMAMWEQLAGVGLSLGLIALFSRVANAESPRLRWLADRSFAVYVLHAPVLIGLAMLFRPLPYHLYGLVALLTMTGLIASFLVADLARRLPGLRAIL
jgi:peptidoglycan/LPS O-acetylase OafA/YrhL